MRFTVFICDQCDAAVPDAEVATVHIPTEVSETTNPETIIYREEHFCGECAPKG